MEAPSSTAGGATPEANLDAIYAAHDTAAARRRRLRPAALALAVAAGFLTLTMAGSSAAAPAAPAAVAADPDFTKIAKLTKEIKALEKEYGSNLEQLRDARSDAKKAMQKVKNIKGDLTEARQLVSQLAASQYMSNGLDPAVYVVTGDNPADVLAGATLARHISETKSAKVQQIQTLMNQQEKAKQEADTKVTKLEADIKEVSKQRARVKKLLQKYKPESPIVGLGGMTPRMIKVKDEIEEKFGPFPTIGCTRPGDPLDHGQGKACDFMESTGGVMPTSARQQHGDDVAAWAIKNASRLGIKYIIWKQRIYDLRSPGWKAMSDRGSITQNHFDHVHISVF